MEARPDLIFSYWIIAWFLLYYFTSYIEYSPKFLLIIGLLFNSGVFLTMVYNKMNLYYLFTFFVAIFLLKLIPIYLLREENIEKRDVDASFVLFSIFLVYFVIFKGGITNSIQSFKKGFQKMTTGKTETPIMKMLLGYE
jgi:hypothetical protein